MKFHDFIQVFIQDTGASGAGATEEGAKGLIDDLFELAVISMATVTLIAERLDDGLTEEAKEMASVMRDGIIGRLADTLARNVTPLGEKEATAAKIDEQKAALAAAMKSFSGTC